MEDYTGAVEVELPLTLPEGEADSRDHTGEVVEAPLAAVLRLWGLPVLKRETLPKARVGLVVVLVLVVPS